MVEAVATGSTLVTDVPEEEWAWVTSSVSCIKEVVSGKNGFGCK